MIKGSKHSKETKRKLSKALKGKYQGKNSPHWKEKIRKTCLICKKELFIIPSKKNIVKYCSRRCQAISKKYKATWNKGTKGICIAWNKGKKFPQFSMEKSYAWKGGKTIHSTGYIFIYIPTHPYAHNGYVFEHRLVMEKHLGRYLKPEERVHHINKIKDDNRPENLKLFNNESEHQKFHNR